jgi:hypothetical protein
LPSNTSDVTATELIWDDPLAWLRALSIGWLRSVETMDSTTTSAGGTTTRDRVLLIDGSFLVSFKACSGQAPNLRQLSYEQARLERDYGRPVLAVPILLHPEADSPELTGTVERRLPDGRLTTRYDYRVVRMWEQNVEAFLTGGAVRAAFAPLANICEADLPTVVCRIEERFAQEAPARAEELRAAAVLLVARGSQRT